MLRFEIHNENTGEIVRIKGLVDNGAMVSVMDRDLWDRVGHRLPPYTPSERRLHMANGATIMSTGRWTGTFRFGDVKVTNTFEIFPSQGAWSFLVGKPMLEALRATHDYVSDIIRMENTHFTSVLHNQYGNNDTIQLTFAQKQA
ncbi:hypothetical protein BV20DRAFT_1037032 [Pilatotrama ljubarskyi]|nr:hypothetical protein BV20DRAFT_1037032 [Pilatotrama ljubarskyi]